ncbi:nephrocystin-3-like [Corticium candelabrum]|uniref:nephrocystin-3-like n=1 Tax=Corticium candelabrum TaxID=121492 RepID=UPI002E2774D4|nr:nephrocystin-3-like [Corticium candelabrum]
MVTKASCLYNLALTYQEWGKYDEAIEKYKESLDLTSQSNDENQVGKSNTLMNLGYCYMEIRKLKESLCSLKKAVKISRSCYLSPHPSLALAIRYLSYTKLLLDRKDEAWKLAREALDIASVSLKSSPAQLALYMNCVARCCSLREDSIVWYQKSHKLLQQLPSSPIRDDVLATTLNSLALEYQREGKYAEAIKTFEESKRRCNDGNLVRRATVLTNIGGCYRESGNLEKSLSELEEAVTISRSCYSSSHPSLAAAILQLSYTYHLLDRNVEARKLAREALDIANVPLPSSHSQL